LHLTRRDISLAIRDCGVRCLPFAANAGKARCSICNARRRTSSAFYAKDLLINN
jgi:hypothetical protein